MGTSSRYSPLIGDIRLNRIDLIGSIVADKYGVTSQMLKTRSRLREICEPRQITMFIAYKLTNFTYSIIGSHFNRDHATVLHAVKTVGNLMQVDSDYRGKLEALIAECKQYMEAEITEVKDRYKHTIQLSDSKAIMLMGFTSVEVQVFKQHNSL